MEVREFLVLTQLDRETLDVWVEAGWLVPGSDGGARRFSEIDVARTQLISDLKRDLGVNDEGVSIILDLVDQIGGLRRVVDKLLALHALPGNGSAAPPRSTR